MTARKHKTTPRAQWGEIRAQYDAGESLLTLATYYGLNLVTLRSRASREKWVQNRRVPGDLDASPLAGKLRQNVTPAILQENRPETGTALVRQNDAPQLPALPSAAAMLAELVEAPPEAFQAGFIAYAQKQIAEGLPDIAAPRNIAELKTWMDLLRKAAGLDVKTATGANLPLVNPLRTVSRRGRIVEEPREGGETVPELPGGGETVPELPGGGETVPELPGGGDPLDGFEI